MGKRSRFFIRETLLPFCYALVVLSLIGAVAFFGFRYRPETERGMNESDRPETRLWKSTGDKFPVDDPTIPARGDAPVGFAAFSFANEVGIALPPEKNGSDTVWKVADPPEIPPPPEDKFIGFADVMPDFSVPAPLRGNEFSVRRGDGTLFPVGGNFTDVPDGSPVSRTAVRIIPVGGAAVCRLNLAESCGDPALDDYALRELAKFKFDRHDLICIYWGAKEEKK
ncbi:MAG: hypothetical protein MJ016_00395 [Victivallaceae bacterium]|nr:hypothetical protein [Victivallaceae bacterium]